MRERMPRRHPDGLLLARAADHVKAGDELGCPGERPLVNLGYSLVAANRPGHVGSLQRAAQQVDAAGLEILPPGSGQTARSRITACGVALDPPQCDHGRSRTRLPAVGQ
jgi:hypothetical protein